jgi:hypothetical protein
MRVRCAGRRHLAGALLALAIGCAVRSAAPAAVRPPGPQVPAIKVVGLRLPAVLGELLGWGFLARFRA